MNVRGRVDVVVVGAGIVGLATAHALLDRRSDLSVLIVDKEDRVAAHQSGRNSGVIHSGIYYRPGSLKATTAVSGAKTMMQFCAEHQIPHERCGKLIVALDDAERVPLDDLLDRAHANGVRARRIGPDELRELEPHAAGVAALHVEDTGIVDFGEVSRTLSALVVAAGGDLALDERVLDVIEAPTSVTIETARRTLEARFVVNCAGLHADEVASRALDPHPDVRIVPFRGEFHELVAARRHLVRHLIYPVPDPELPFLGVHLTRGIDGGVHAGPNAVLALAREGYSWRDIDRRELVRLVRFPGFRRLARHYWRVGAGEVNRSLRVRAFARALRRLVPDLEAHDLVPASAGVRAQAIDRRGRLLDDFVLRESPRAVHVLNAPSPAATASLVIGSQIADKVLERL